MNIKKKSSRILLSFVLMFAAAVLFATAAFAEEGWTKKGKKTYYYVQTAQGPVKAVGLQQIGGRFFYFKNNGVMKTGWVKTADGYRYFRKKGKLGVKGRMYIGFKKIDGKKFYFDPETGVMQTGLIDLPKGTYYFKKKGKAGVRGSAYISRWATINGGRYYFNEKGRMARSQWIKGYYVGADGRKLVKTVTPDGYKVGKKGKKLSKTKVNGWVKLSGKWYYFKLPTGFYKNTFITEDDEKYYVDANGVRVTGTQTINGKVYVFDATTGALTEEPEETSQADAGQETAAGTKKPKVLIVAGHGQGDSGAVSVLGQEYLKTREFAKLVYQQLLQDGKVDVEYYKNGSTSYDMYQQHAKTLGSSGAKLSSKITGSGAYKKKVKAACKKNPNLPVLTNYDYVLEIHFNATAPAAKDTGGNGKQKGFSYYVNSRKKQHKVEKNTIAKMKKLGFATFGGGVHKSATLFNARICQELGVDYSLAETAFIDDKDDMNFYNKHKKAMAKAVAEAIEEYYK